MATARKFRHSLGYWCLHDTDWKWSLDQICGLATKLAVESIELLPLELIPELKKYGLGSALAFNGMPGAAFVKGLNNRRYHDEVIARTKETIEVCAAAGVPNVIAFTGYKWINAEDPSSGEIPLEEGADNCVEGLQQLAGFAERAGVTLCLEQLNTVDGTHPMKGHPGYQGDNMDYCAEIVRRAGSPRVKLLFDVYHVQIMHGDVIRRIHKYADLIGHVHTAGNPGRGELDDRQEIHFPGVMRALENIGYSGFIGHEFIPTRDPLASFREAVAVCES